MVWGPLGVLFVAALGVALDHYFSNVRPRAKQSRKNEDEAHKAHLQFLARTEQTMDQLVRNNETVTGCIQRYDSRLNNIDDRITDGFQDVNRRLDTLCGTRRRPPSQESP